MKLTFNNKVAQERTQSNTVSKQRNVKVALDHDFCYQLPFTMTRSWTTFHDEALTLSKTQESLKGTSVHITRTQ